MKQWPVLSRDDAKEFRGGVVLGTQPTKSAGGTLPSIPEPVDPVGNAIRATRSRWAHDVTLRLAHEILNGNWE